MNKGRNPSSLIDSFRYAGKGIVTTIKYERNFRIELAFAIFALIASAILALTPVEWAIIIVLIVLVLALELTNSAIESIVDIVSPETHPLAGRIKDGMAGAVLVMAIGSAAAGLVIFVSAALRLWGA